MFPLSAIRWSLPLRSVPSTSRFAEMFPNRSSSSTRRRLKSFVTIVACTCWCCMASCSFALPASERSDPFRATSSVPVPCASPWKSTSPNRTISAGISMFFPCRFFESTSMVCPLSRRLSTLVYQRGILLI